MLQNIEKTQAKEIPFTSLDSLIKPLEMIFASNLTKFYPVTLSIIQIFAGSSLMSFERKISFIDHSIKLLDTAIDMIPIKILQILLMSLSRSDIRKFPFASKISGLCLKAFSSKNQNIKNTVFAVMRQMYSLLFEEYINECKELHVGEELQKICLEQIEQLVELTGDKYKQLNFKGLGMDMLTIILAETKGFFNANPSVVHLFENSYVYNLSTYFLGDITSVPLILRAIKASTQLILDAETGYTLIYPILKMSESEITWHRYLVLESICTLFSDRKQVQHLHETINENTNTSVYLYIQMK